MGSSSHRMNPCLPQGPPDTEILPMYWAANKCTFSLPGEVPGLPMCYLIRRSPSCVWNLIVFLCGDKFKGLKEVALVEQ
jgi:hypothetical protein